MNLAGFSVQRPVTAAMLLISILALGTIAALRLPLTFLPHVDAPEIGIEIPYPDSSPAEVERMVTKPVEEALAGLSGVKTMRSTSTADSARIDLGFRWNQELDLVRMAVSDKIDGVRGKLPDRVGQIQVWSFSTSDMPIFEARVSSRGIDLSQAYELLDRRVAHRLRRVPGVARVDLGGVSPREVRIDLVLDAILAHGIDIGRLVENLREAPSTMVLGPVDDSRRRFTARVQGQYGSLDALRQLPTGQHGLVLGDIAEIEYVEPPVSFGRHLDREPAIALTIFKESTARTVEVVRAIGQVIETEINTDPMLAGIELFMWENQADEITSGIEGLRQAGAYGAVFAVATLFIFLRQLRSTLIVSLSIPFSLIATCGAMYFMGKTLNMLSMMGLMLGVGMLVDNAIVVLEAIDRTGRQEPSPRQAAILGTRQVAVAVTASTLTSVIVFLPLIVGASTDLTTWLREVGITITIALGCSLLSSLTLIPLLASRAPKRASKAATPLPPPAFAALEEGFARVLAWTLRHRIKTYLLAIVGVGVGMLPLILGGVEMGMFSAQVNNRLQLRYEFHDFHHKSEAERAVDQVEAYLTPHREEFSVASIYSYFGENEAATILLLNRKDLSDDAIKELRTEIRDGLPAIPGVRVFFDENAEEGGSTTSFSVKLYGEDSDTLSRLAAETDERLHTIEGVHDIQTGKHRASYEIRAHIDRERAAGLGLSAADLADIFGFSLGGMRLPRSQIGAQEAETWLALRIEDRQRLEDLRRLEFRGDGMRVRLGDIARFETVRVPPEIVREDRQVRAQVSATYDGESWEKTRETISTAMNEMNLPTGYTWSWDDRILEQDDQSAQMGLNFLLALVLVYLVLASLFESLLQPVTILFSILFALPGGVWALFVTGTPFNLMAQIGVLILMGIVVNNGVVLLDYANQLRQTGMSREEALILAGRERMRPILMTASTTIIGLLPLAIGSTAISGLFYYPLARTVVGGLLSSACFTLLVLPNLVCTAERMRDRVQRVWAASRVRA